MTRIVVDPGHGGHLPTGRSSPTGLRGPGGLLEKDVVLDLGLRLANALRARGCDVALTRDRDENPAIGGRAAFAGDLGADAFVSLHLHEREGAPAMAWVHDRATEPSRHLAAALGAEVRSGPLAVLDPARLGAPAVLYEAGALATGEDEARWRDVGERTRAAETLADAIEAWARTGRPAVAERRVRRFELWHEVPLVPQLTGMSCWAAAAAMIVGWREMGVVDPEEVARGAGRWREYRAGLLPSDVGALARAWGLQEEASHTFDVTTLAALLHDRGPLWLGEADPGLHVIVVTGMTGDGTPEGTTVRVNDPWPAGRGERYSLPFKRLAASFEAVERIAGLRARILHNGTGATGTRRALLHEDRVRVGIR